MKPPRPENPRPGDAVVIYNQRDIVDGARATVLGTKQGWIVVNLDKSGFEKIVAQKDVRIDRRSAGGAQ